MHAHCTCVHTRTGFNADGTLVLFYSDGDWDLHSSVDNIKKAASAADTPLMPPLCV